MLWLDGVWPADGDASQPGIERGDCPADSGEPDEVVANNPDAYVPFLLDEPQSSALLTCCPVSSPGPTSASAPSAPPPARPKRLPRSALQPWPGPVSWDPVRGRRDKEKGRLGNVVEASAAAVAIFMYILARPSILSSRM